MRPGLTLHNVVRTRADDAASRDGREADLERALAAVLAVHDARGAVDLVRDEAKDLAGVQHADGAVVVEAVVGRGTLAARGEDGECAGYLVPSAQVLGQVVGELGIGDGVVARSIVEGGIDAISSGVGGALNRPVRGSGGRERRQCRDEKLLGVHFGLVVATSELPML